MEQTSKITINDVSNNKFIHINKIGFMNNLEKLYNDNTLLLRKFKENFNSIELIFNGKSVDDYMSFLDKIVSNHQDYLKSILMLTGEACYIQVLNNLKNIIDTDYHVIFEPEQKTKIQITMHHLCKQIRVNLRFKIFKINSLQKIYCEQDLETDIIVDLINMEPIVFVVKNL